MKAICLALGLMIAATAARADDITAMISQYRREHGLPAVKTDAKLTAVAQRQAQAMAAAGIMDHDVAGAFATRISGVGTDSAAENIAAGTKTWADTLRMWKASPGHNANLLYPGADLLGVAVSYNESTRYKSYWAMVIGHKATKVKTRTASGYNWGGSSGSAGPDVVTGVSSAASSVGDALKRALSPLRSLLP